jgi:hypothetical protein
VENYYIIKGPQALPVKTFTSVGRLGSHNGNRTSSQSQNFLEDIRIPLTTERFRLQTVNSISIKKVIRKLPNKTSAGHNEVIH